MFYDIFEIVQKHLRSGDAVDLHSVQDYKNTKIDDITKTLNISHGLFYHYFKNKTDLIKGIVEYADGAVMSKFKEIAEAKLPDLNCSTVEAAMNMVKGQAVSMGIKVVE